MPTASPVIDSGTYAMSLPSRVAADDGSYTQRISAEPLKPLHSNRCATTDRAAPSGGTVGRNDVSSRFGASRWNSQPLGPTCGGPLSDATIGIGDTVPSAV